MSAMALRNTTSNMTSIFLYYWQPAAYNFSCIVNGKIACHKHTEKKPNRQSKINSSEILALRTNSNGLKCGRAWKEIRTLLSNWSFTCQVYGCVCVCGWKQIHLSVVISSWNISLFKWYEKNILSQNSVFGRLLLLFTQTHIIYTTSTSAFILSEFHHFLPKQ